MSDVPLYVLILFHGIPGKECMLARQSWGEGRCGVCFGGARWSLHNNPLVQIKGTAKEKSQGSRRDAEAGGEVAAIILHSLACPRCGWGI